MENKKIAPVVGAGNVKCAAALLPRLFGFDAARFGLLDDRLIMARLESVLGDATFAQTQISLYTEEDR